MKFAIVTGATGFIGRNVVSELISNGITVYAFVRNKKKLPIHPLVKPILFSLEKGISLEDEERLRKVSIDVFYHFAWDGYTGSDRSNEILQLKNVQFTVNTLKMAARLNSKKFIGAGSIMEKESLYLSYKTSNEVPLTTIYGSGKVAAHLMSKAFASSLSIEYIWTFITNTYGPGENSARFINTTLKQILYKKTLNFTSATQNYDFIYISDLARAYYLIGKFGHDRKEYTIGTGEAQLLRNFIERIIYVVPSEKIPNFDAVPFSGIHLPIEAYDTQSLYNDTKFLPRVSFEEGILRTKEWIIKTEGIY